MSRMAFRLVGVSPMASSGKGLAPASSRNTTSSRPREVGTVTTRSSTGGPPKREKSILPSWGLRCSEMSMLAMILMRATKA